MMKWISRLNVLLKFSFLFPIFSFLLLANCNSNPKNLCDPATNEFLRLSILKSILNDSSPSCGLNWANTNNGSFTLGGTISGLTASGLVLSSGTSPNQTVSLTSGSTNFQFSNVLALNSTYSVTISTQPAGLNCTVSNGSGTITAKVVNVAITCVLPVVATPTFSPTPGNYGTVQANITITTTTASATIYYTTDGSTPTTASTLYTTGLGHIWFLAGRTLRAIAVRSGFTNSNIASAEYSYIPVKSGQPASFVAGDDGTSQLGIARSYTDNLNETVTDNATGLLWQKCSLGLSDAVCSTGSATTRAWAPAQTDCTALTTAGRAWRLPSRYELETLQDYGTFTPSINGTVFPATQTLNGYWSSTTNELNSINAWLVGFNLGDLVGTQNKTNNPIFYVRCVSGPSQTSFVKYIDNGNGTVLDRQTGLVWQKCSVGQNNDAVCSGGASSPDWTTALANCSGLGLASRTWRLPNVKELQTIFDVSRTSFPTIDTNFFPATVNAKYWSSTTYAVTAVSAWVVDFNDGSSNFASKGSNLRVRCVSGP